MANDCPITSNRCRGAPPFAHVPFKCTASTRSAPISRTGPRRHRMRQHAIHQVAPANLDRQKHSRISATGAHRIDDRSRVKHHAFAGIEVGCGHAERNAQLFKRLHLQSARQERNHAVVRGEAAARERPARKGSEAHAVRDLFHFLRATPAAIARPDQRAHARASDHADRNAFLFENLQNSDVRDAAGKSSAQRHANGWNSGRRNRGSLAGEFPPKGLNRPNNLPQTLHSQPHISRPEQPRNSHTAV